MPEYGNQYSNLQGFSYFATAIINALNSLSNNLTIPIEKTYFKHDDTLSIINNNTGSTQRYYLSNLGCSKISGVVIYASNNNTNDVLINGIIPLRKGSTLLYTAEQNRRLDITTLFVDLQPSDEFRYILICIN